MNLLLWWLLQIKFFLHSSYYLLISLLLLLRELEQLAWEALCMVVLLWHAYEQVVAALCYLWCNLELGICQWVQLDVLIVWIDGGHHTFLNDEVEDEQETAAHLDDLWWLTTREDNQLVLVDESALDVEVLDLEVELAVGEPSPLFLGWLQTNIALIDCGFKLE